MRRDVFQAIADPVRRDIIEMLADEVMTVNAIAQKFEISRPAISKHLKILNECGIVHLKKIGRERFCYIKGEELIPAFMWIEKYKSLWEDRLDEFELYLKKLKKTRSNEK